MNNLSVDSQISELKRQVFSQLIVIQKRSKKYLSPNLGIPHIDI